MGKVDDVAIDLQKLLRFHGVEIDLKWNNAQLLAAVRKLLITDEQERNRLVATMIDALKTIETPPNMPPMVAELFKSAVGPRQGSMTRHLIDSFAAAIVEGKPPKCDTH